MMHDHKKTAMMIVRGMSEGYGKKEHDPTEDQSMKTPTEHKQSDDSRMGVEISMDKFIAAVHDKDTKKAMEAMTEFLEMSSGMEYQKDDVEGSMHEDPKED